MDRPGVFTKSLRSVSVPIILASFLLSLAALAEETPTQSEQGADNMVRRRVAEHFLTLGKQQYELGYYAEAQKTLQMASRHAQYLEPLDQRKLDLLVKECNAAVVRQQQSAAANARHAHV